MSPAPTVAPDAVDRAAFAGLFFGEGHIDLFKAAEGRGWVPRLRLVLREDDKDVLDWIMARFGGFLVFRRGNRSWCWNLTGRDRVRATLETLRDCPIPSKKRPEIQLALRAVALVPGRSRNISTAAAVELAEIKTALIRVRRSYRAALSAEPR